MKLLLTDATSLSGRQTARLLHEAGHHVGVLGGSGPGLASMTHAVRKRHPVPRYGDDPIAWVQAAITVMQRWQYDALVPTQEQAAALSACADEIASAGVRTAVPTFEALRRVQDKTASAETLAALGIPTPTTTVVDRAEATAWTRFPIYAKLPVATGSTGVVRAESTDDLLSLGSAGPLVLQEPITGPLLMVQTVWCRGELVAAHANERVAEGAGGGASRKCSVRADAALEQLTRLGKHLSWHGALCADAIVTRDGPKVIDVNPRLVEPANAAASGVDLVGALVEAGFDQATPQPGSRPGVRTHQLLLALTGAARNGAHRRQIASEAVQAIARRGAYRHSQEELTPIRGGDWRSGVLTGAVLVALLARPGTWRWFADGTVSSYALTPDGWDALREHASR